MTKEEKLKIDPESLEQASKKIGELLVKNVKKGVDDSITSLNSGDLKKKFSETFSLKNLPRNLKSAIEKGYSGSTKKQESMSKILQKNRDLSAAFTKSIRDGAGASEILSSGLKLAGNHTLGMLKNVNPYLAALKVGVATIKEFLQYYQKTLEVSQKFITSSSLFTDRATMQMMQRTGQSASGAQGTNRALDRLGISFEDIQSGNVTKDQMAMFEQIRKEETARLEAIAKVGGPVFESMQYAAVGVAKAKQQFSDMITMAFAKSKGVLTFANNLQSVASQVGDMIWGIGDSIVPIVDVAASLTDMILGAVKPIMNVVSVVVQEIGKLASIAGPAISTLVGVVKKALDTASKSISVVVRIAGVYFQVIVAKFSVIAQVVGAIMDAIANIATPLMDGIVALTEPIFKIFDVSKAMVALQPVLDIVVKVISLAGAGIGWLVGKIMTAYKWLQEKILSGVEWAINIIPKGFHSMIEYVVGLLNKIPGVSLAVPEYKNININSALGNISAGLDNAITSIQGDTFNYNYGVTGTSQASPSSTANQNLFANQYILVND